VLGEIQERPVQHDQRPSVAGGGNIITGALQKRAGQYRESRGLIIEKPPRRLRGSERAARIWQRMKTGSEGLGIRQMTHDQAFMPRYKPCVDLTKVGNMQVVIGLLPEKHESCVDTSGACTMGFFGSPRDPLILVEVSISQTDATLAVENV
jgi:hypothetical protein